MNSKELREKFISFFQERGHKIVPSSSLVPNDETVLLTTAGMQQFVLYLTGEKNVVEEFGTHHLASVQKCFRTPDIEEIGDDTHHTFFEMLGNWSIGEGKEKGYFKRGAIELAMDFFIKEIGLSKDRIYVTVFQGEGNVPRDEEAISIWEEHGFPKERIGEFGMDDNFWGPTADTGPCGPCSEIHYDRGESYGCKETCGPNCERCNRFVELWNLVFMEYNKNEGGSYTKLSQRNIDTGIGFERLVSLLQGKDSAYETDLFRLAIKKIEEISGKKYEENKKEFRVVADHVRGSIFLVADGVLPSNKGVGYVLRRVIRRAVRYRKELGIDSLKDIINVFVNQYSDLYPELRKENILQVVEEEEEKFMETLQSGVSELRKKISKESSPEEIGKKLFFIYQSYGFPFELSMEEIEKMMPDIHKNAEKIKKFFEDELYQHQEISRKGAKEKFGGLRKNAENEEVKLHTATHLLHQALREVLGDHVKQMGSDINEERLRFDFSHPGSLSKEEVERVEIIVNNKIKEDLPVEKKEMSFKEVQKDKILAFFKNEYPEKVTVYSVGSFSAEVCGGPHVKRTSELGKFTIKKQESSGAGVRRIKAILQ